jgi:kynureninase
MNSIRRRFLISNFYDDEPKRRERLKKGKKMLLDAETCSICLDIFDRATMTKEKTHKISLTLIMADGVARD